MKYQTDDIRISGMQELLPPERLMDEQPISESSSKLVFESRNKISEIINQNKWGASIHTDSPHTKHAWPTKINCVFTFTISIQSPNNGSGLRFWLNEENFHNISPVYYDDLIEDDKRKLEEEAIYIPYKIGYIYEHDGNTYHQIATEKDFKPNERRISLQGHLSELDNNIILYV